MSTIRTNAIILRRTNYGEADRIIQILTPSGKMSVMVKSARREKSRLAGGIELFAICDLVINVGQGELGILTSARMIKFYSEILKDYDRLQFAYRVIKVVSSASESTDVPDWYDVLSGVLNGLGQPKMSLELIKTWFFLRYSMLIGYELSLQLDINGQKLSPEANYRYDVEEKGFVISDNGNITSDHIKLLRLIASKSLNVLSQIGGIDNVLPDCVLVAQEHAAIN